ncbi:MULTISPECIES: hypothetical protein [Dokdonia]|uniref:EF-hand domain-containing protein n=1 Tax=Dokdonia donghaensis DSW-1 TaxID=1300343 RepID=A0A0A2H0C5_9FLAO|nr:MULTISPECIES: hypothetical protein [Dokdonia]ANH59841.1 EF hand [Dokdonia donghaensis DSW-1]EAQ38166.2 hypothetical protein MED134_10730 [Dokdonia sp. MED134]KGO08031.1 hypothetical protein NV36_10210 [Dokdonia donghaensis DSW-1]
MKKINFKMSALAIVFTLGIVSVSCAQGQRNNDRKEPPTFAQLLKDMDANEDNKLDKSEIKGPLKEAFKEVDTNEDGFITEKEFKKAPKPKRREPRGKK